MKLLFALLLLPSVAPASSIGIRPDCSERKTSVEELKKIAARSEIRHMVDFLRALPSGSLQTFTFVKETKSFQHHGTSARWPRVLRTTADMRLALSFVCNPESLDYGRVEVLHYVPPPVATWRSLSLDFREKKPVVAGVKESEVFGSSRIHENSPTCVKCHSIGGAPAEGLLPIVPQYKTWEGFFGSDDDVIHKGTAEEQDYLSFLKRAKANPCFATLPWPKSQDPAYALYPFHEGFPEEKVLSGRYSLSEETKQIKIRNYHLRPNLKLTDAYSHLMAQRLAWRFLHSAEYREVAPLLMMEAANCGSKEVAEGLEKALPGYRSPPPLHRHTFMDPRSEMSWTKQLFAVGKRIGIGTREWTMHFNDTNDPYYNTGAAGDEGRDISIGKMAQGVLLSHLADTYPNLKPHFRMARSVSKFFAPQDFSCIDDVAGQIAIDDGRNQALLCTQLAEIAKKGKNSKYAKLRMPENSSDEQAEEVNSQIAGDELLARLARGLAPAKPVEIERGKALVESSCKGCHGETKLLPGTYHFLKDEQFFADQLANPAFLWTAIAYVESGRMPKGSKLTEDEKRAVQLYLLDRAQRKTGLSR